MNILQVNYCDLPGKVFNGYDLQKSLNAQGIAARQMVLDKTSNDKNSLKMCSESELFVRAELINIERQYGMFNLLEPFKDAIAQSSAFGEADIIHYHIIHLYMVSLYSMEYLFGQKANVWTLHDPWAISGRCVHPLECEKWKTGCYNCTKWEEAAFPTRIDKAHDLWNVKKKVFQKIADRVDLVVASDWMLSRVKESPLTGQFKNVHKIPFGIEISDYENKRLLAAKDKYDIPRDNLVIGFRAESDPLKGTKYILKALEKLKSAKPITIITIGHMKLPEWLNRYFQVIELGWQSKEGVATFLSATDIFVMPSLAESFGLMAIEAMASKCTVVIFDGTALESVTEAPYCGVAVPYKNVEKLRDAIEQLLESPEERMCRGERGLQIVKEKYRYKDYLRKHIEMYEEIMQRKTEKVYYQYDGEFFKRQNSIQEGLTRMKQLRKVFTIEGIDTKIAVVSNSREGINVYKELLEHLIPVSYVVGRCQWNNVDLSESVIKLENEEELLSVSNLIIILADGEDIGEEIRKIESSRIITRSELNVLMERYPILSEISQMKEIPDLDYSSKGVEKLIVLFNQTIENICNYYEERLNERN